MKQKNLLYLIILGTLGAGIYFFVIKKPWGTLNTSETDFAVEDTAAISKILIANMQGEQVMLERQNANWTVNGKFTVRNDYMQSLLSTIKRVAISYPVPDAAQGTVVTEMASNNRRVEIYDAKGELLKAYFVGGSSLDNLGTFMLMDGAKKPYVTAIPGFHGTLQSRYVTDEEKIRNLNIYSFRLNEMKEVEVKYNPMRDSSFIISILGADSFQLKNSKGEVSDSEQIDRERIRSYLNHFKFINAEAYVNDLEKNKDTVLQTRPFCTITVVDRSNQSHSTVCYYMPVTRESVMQFDLLGKPIQYDADRYFATINDGKDFVIIQEFHFGRLFKYYSYFLNISPQKTHE